MSEILATSPALPGEAATVELRLADMMETAEVRVDGYRLSDSDRAKVVAALRTPSPDGVREARGNQVLEAAAQHFDATIHETWRRDEVADFLRTFKWGDVALSKPAGDE